MAGSAGLSGLTDCTGAGAVPRSTFMDLANDPVVRKNVRPAVAIADARPSVKNSYLLTQYIPISRLCEGYAGLLDALKSVLVRVVVAASAAEEIQGLAEWMA